MKKSSFDRAISQVPSNAAPKPAKKFLAVKKIESKESASFRSASELLDRVGAAPQDDFPEEARQLPLLAQVLGQLRQLEAANQRLRDRMLELEQTRGRSQARAMFHLNQKVGRNPIRRPCSCTKSTSRTSEFVEHPPSRRSHKIDFTNPVAPQTVQGFGLWNYHVESLTTFHCTYIRRHTIFYSFLFCFFATGDRSSTKCPSRVHVAGHGSVTGPVSGVGWVWPTPTQPAAAGWREERVQEA